MLQNKKLYICIHCCKNETNGTRCKIFLCLVERINMDRELENHLGAEHQLNGLISSITLNCFDVRTTF